MLNDYFLFIILLHFHFESLNLDLLKYYGNEWEEVRPWQECDQNKSKVFVRKIFIVLTAIIMETAGSKTPACSPAYNKQYAYVLQPISRHKIGKSLLFVIRW